MIEKEKYRVQILYDSSIKEYSIHAFKFVYWDPIAKEWAGKITKQSKKPFLVFGTCANAMFQFIEEKKPDVLFFIGDDETYSLYQKLGSRASMKLSNLYGFDEVKEGKDIFFILFKTSLPPDFKDWIRTNLQQFLSF